MIIKPAPAAGVASLLGVPKEGQPRRRSATSPVKLEISNDDTDDNNEGDDFPPPPDLDNLPPPPDLPPPGGLDDLPPPILDDLPPPIDDGDIPLDLPPPIDDLELPPPMVDYGAKPRYISLNNKATLNVPKGSESPPSADKYVILLSGLRSTLFCFALSR